jgi:hypothetical protein
MKHIFSILLSFASIHYGYSQCSTCTIGFSGCPSGGGLCNKPDTGMANQPYQTIIRFYLPKRLNDPTLLAQCSGCSYIQLDRVKIAGITGLPTGVSNYVFNQTQAPWRGFYNVANNDTLGCVSICGTPIAAGTYILRVNVEADVVAIGTPIGNVNPGPQNLTFSDTLIILPDTSGAVSSFTFGGVRESCDSVRLNLDAILSALPPNPTRYFWDFGNSTTGNMKTPGFKTYNSPGTYNVSLKTVYYDYKISRLQINNMSNPTSCWRGDVEELLTGDPDVYVKISSLGVNTRGNSVSGTTNLNIPIPAAQSIIPQGTTSLSFELWDEDNGPPLGSPDDNMGTYTIALNAFPFFPFDVNFSGSCASGYVRIDTVRSTVIDDTLKVNVKGRPTPPIVIASSDTVCSGDSIRLSASPYCADCTYEWVKDDTTIVFGATDSVLYTKETGAYKLNVLDNITGCSNTGLVNTNVAIVQSPPSFIGVAYFSPTQRVFANPGVQPGFRARWYKDGLEIPGQTGTQIPYLGDGVYQVEIFNIQFPACISSSDTVRISTVGIENESLNSYKLDVFPNPTNSSLNVSLYILANQVEINILDMTGKSVYSEKFDISNEKLEQKIDVSNFAKGVYTLRITSNGQRINRKVVVN